MKTFFSLLVYFSAFLSFIPFLRPKERSTKIILWVPKLFAGALSPIICLISGVGCILGISSRNWKLWGSAIIGLGFSGKFIKDIPNSNDKFAATFGQDWMEKIPASKRSRLFIQPKPKLIRKPKNLIFQQNMVIGQKTENGKPLLGDLWRPHANSPHSGLGLIYAHGSGWRVGDKDLGTRYFFRRLAEQGHAVLDVAYTLWPQANVSAMVTEIYQAILWMKKEGDVYGVKPERIVLMGGSAGAHLALTAAYVPNHPTFLPSADAGDTSVCGVVAFYPPVDMLAIHSEVNEYLDRRAVSMDDPFTNLMARFFMLQAKYVERDGKVDLDIPNFVEAILGCKPDNNPELYQLLSPIKQVGSHCPPTLILQGCDDNLVSSKLVRHFYLLLQDASVPSILIEFPNTEHGFDLLFPQISPVAQAAISNVEHFLSLLI